MDAIVAYYQNWGIGSKGTQPIVIPEDRKHFREITEGGTVVVGRKTLEDFPDGKPLKNRKTIVLTHQEIEIEGATVAHSVEEVLQMVKDQPKVFLIGGASVYNALLPYCEKVYITKIYARPECDTFFLNLDENFEWSFESESELMTSSTGMQYRYYVYEKYYINNVIKKL